MPVRVEEYRRAVSSRTRLPPRIAAIVTPCRLDRRHIVITLLRMARVAPSPCPLCWERARGKRARAGALRLCHQESPEGRSDSAAFGRLDGELRGTDDAATSISVPQRAKESVRRSPAGRRGALGVAHPWSRYLGGNKKLHLG
ncbi:MAG: hypothetical protein M5U19_17780, partial [Microthrixaceae bacterium]|nr:hypothetical protein [Microthrixaceae bacterium]